MIFVFLIVLLWQELVAWSLLSSSLRGRTLKTLNARLPAARDFPLIDFNEEEIMINEVSIRAARLAGDAILAGSVRDKEVEAKCGSRDIVTRVDKEAQTIIAATIRSIFPTHSFLGEEDVPSGRQASQKAVAQLQNAEHLWIVDPIDGTTNYAHGIPLVGVIIAYARQGVVQHGMIYDPFRDELFFAWKGRGAFLNNQRITCDAIRSLDTAVVCTGSPPNIESLEACLRVTAVLSPYVHSVRMFGSAAIMLAWIACGRVSAYVEADLNAWDLAAGALLVEEAGGRVTDVWQQDLKLTTRNLVATNGHLHQHIIAKATEARMWMADDLDKPSQGT